MPTRLRWTLLTALAGALPIRAAYAQDMVGPDWLKLLLAAPKVLLYAIGEISLVLAPLLGLLALVSWIVPRLGGDLGRRVPGTSTLVVLTVLTAVPALIFWSNAPDTSSDPFKSYRSTTTKARKVDALVPPVGRSWPRETGYLEMPQSAQGGHGVIRVSGRGSQNRVYVKLCEARMQPCSGLRHAFVEKGSELVLRNLPPGAYEVRYMFIDRPIVGGRSQPITISEYMEDDHVVKITDSPVLESNYPVVGIYLKDF
jgi:hypothetical protein